jgi:HK97 family phage portal protein
LFAAQPRGILRRVGLFSRAIQPPPDDITPNPNPPGVPPASVGPPDAQPGDPHGVTVDVSAPPVPPPPRVLPSAWSGWPAEWWIQWNGQADALTDTAWACLDLNSSVLASMPPYTIPADPAADIGWIANPNPDVYASWEEFVRSLMWDYLLGEAFVMSTARYFSGYPARFHVVPPWAVEVEIAQGVRTYKIGEEDVTRDMLHIRYKSTVADARGTGPLEVGKARMIADRVLNQYVSGFAAAGGIPTSVLTHPDMLDADQAAELKAQWVAARQSGIGEPAVLSGGVAFEAIQTNPKDMALFDLSQVTGSKIATLLRVPPLLVGLPGGGDPMTYQNVASIFDYHWRAHLRPLAQAVMSALSGWLLPRGSSLELNRDSYVQSEPESRARTYQILNSIQGPEGPAMSVEEIRAAERFAVAGAAGLTPATGVAE